MHDGRSVGIIVFPEYFQTEGVEAALDNLSRRTGLTALATSPYVMAPSPDAGSREPPIDAGAGGVRLLDRPLWGRRELLVRTSPSFVPDRALYRGLRYQPPEPDDLTRSDGDVIARVIDAAHARGLKVYLQVQAAIPPGYRVQFGGPLDEDRPRLPDGSTPARRVDNNGSLASPHIRAYARAMVADLLRAYPAIDGLQVDWPEYPPYSLDAVFFDFSVHAKAAAERLGFDFERMRGDADALRARLLGRLTQVDLADWSEHPGQGLVRMGADHPGFLDLLAFKAALATELVDEFRSALADAAGGGKELLLRTFPPPWTALSGLSFPAVAPRSDGLAVKLFTMHWPMMLRMWGDALATANPQLAGDPALVRGLMRLFDIADDAGLPRLEDYAYPEPDEAHPVGAAAQARKIAAVRGEAGATPVHALAHGYGPVEDFAARFAVAWRASRGRVWVNRYGYLADAKLDAIGRIAAGGSATP